MRFFILGSAIFFAFIGTSSAWLLDNSNELDLDMLYFGGAIIPGEVNVIVMVQTEGYWIIHINEMWIWIETYISISGNPKFKVSQHPDGYSIQVGVDRYFMRMRFSKIDNSIDFSILDYKGSLTYRVQNWTPSKLLDI